MAKKTTRLDKRREVEAAEKIAERKKAAKADPAEKAEKAAAKKKTAVKKPRAKKTKVPVIIRQRMVWGIFDNSHNQVAVFPYSDRPAADKRAEELTAKGKGGAHFVQPVKQPITDADEDESES